MKPPKKLWVRWYECCEGHLGREVHETKREAVDGADKDAGPVTPLKYLLAPQPARKKGKRTLKAGMQKTGSGSTMRATARTIKLAHPPGTVTHWRRIKPPEPKP